MGEIDWSGCEAVVGKRWDYYRPRFERFARGGWLSWNWGAFFATLAWLRYRKLHAWSWAYFFISTPFLLSVALVLAAGDACERALDHGPGAPALMLLLALAGWIVPPLVANRLYFREVQARIGKAGGAEGTGGFIGALALQTLVMVVVAAAAPTHANYRYRAMVAEGVALAVSAKSPLQQYLDGHGRLPARIEEAVKLSPNRYVDRIVLDSDGTIRAIFGASAGKLSGHSVSLIPQMKNGQIADWTCRSQDLPGQCLPAECPP